MINQNYVGNIHYTINWKVINTEALIFVSRQTLFYETLVENFYRSETRSIGALYECLHYTHI